MPVDPQQYRPNGLSILGGRKQHDVPNRVDECDQRRRRLGATGYLERFFGIQPSRAVYRCNPANGYRHRLYNLTGYYAAWFLTGVQPPITHDVLYYFYRREPTNAAGPAQSAPNKLTGNAPAENNIELVSFLTAPATIAITIGGQSFRQDAAAGISSFKVPIAAGNPQFSLSRSGAEVFHSRVPCKSMGHQGCPPASST